MASIMCACFRRSCVHPNGVRVLDTGENFGPYIRDVDDPRYADDWTGGFVEDPLLENTDSPQWVDGIEFMDARVGRPVALVGQDGLYYSVQKHPGGRSTGNYSNPAPAEDVRTLDQWMVYSQNWSRSAKYNLPTDTISNYIIPGVTDKSIYNWEKYNTLAMNYGDQDAKTYNVELDHELLPNLFVQLGWFRQEMDSIQNYTVQQQTGATLYIDTNLKLPTGANNPFFGLPYVEDYLPDTFVNDAENETLRAQVAYTLDFTENDGWSKWLGRHRLLGVASQWKLDTLRLRLRGTHVGGDPRWLPNADLNETASAWRYYGNSSRIRRNYYLARPGDAEAAVTAGGPTYWGQPSWYDVDGRVRGFGGVESAPTWWYNWNTQSWEQALAGYGVVTHEAGSGRTRKEVDSVTAAWQGYFWDDRIITTVGWRKDRYKAQNTIGTAGLSREQFHTEGFLIPEKSYTRWTDTENGEIADSKESLTEETLTTGIVVVPFRWDGGDFRLHYNKSENFDPPGAAQTDLFDNPLPIPRGEGEDYGFSISLFDNKFIAKVSWFEATSEAERTGAAGTLISRVQRIDSEQMVDWATAIAYFDTLNINLGEPEPEGGRPPLTASQQSALEARVEELVGLRFDWPTGLNVGATQTSEAEGMEIQLVYNPMRNWTIKFTAGQQETVFSSVAPEYDAWLAERMPVWTSATSPLTSANDFNTDGDNNPNTFLFNGVREADLTNFWSAYGYNGQATLDNANEWFSTEDFFLLAVDSQVGAAKAQEGIVSPGQREWRWNMITNYQFIDGPLENFSVGGGVRWEDETVIGFLGMESDPSRPGLLLTPNTSRPIKDDAQFHLDLWFGYRTKIFNGKVDMKLQFNVRDALEDGEIRPIRADYAGNLSAYRIIDPRQYYLTATFSF